MNYQLLLNCNKVHRARLEQENNLLDKKSNIERIAREATINLALTMTDAVHLEIQHMWNRRVDSVIDEIVKIAKHVTRQIEKNEFTD
jgi:histone H3/H4